MKPRQTDIDKILQEEENFKTYWKKLTRKQKWILVLHVILFILFPYLYMHSNKK